VRQKNRSSWRAAGEQLASSWRAAGEQLASSWRASTLWAFPRYGNFHIVGTCPHCGERPHCGHFHDMEMSSMWTVSTWWTVSTLWTVSTMWKFPHGGHFHIVEKCGKIEILLKIAEKKIWGGMKIRTCFLKIRICKNSNLIFPRAAGRENSNLFLS
jgi:hypothetical protein